MSNDQKIDILLEVTYSIGNRFVPGYSGRGMYGKKCVAIVTNDPESVIEAAGAQGITGAYTDSFGLDMIVYWPGIAGPQVPDPDDVDIESGPCR